MISKRVLIIAVALMVASATWASAASVTTTYFQVSQLGIGSGSTLDVASYGIVTPDVLHPVPTDYNTIRDYVFNGPIFSTAANNDPSGVVSLGVAKGQDYMDLIGSTFKGHTVDPADSLILPRYWGDVNFDGVVNGDDYALMDIGVNLGPTSYPWGDIDNNGVTNGDDYALADIAINAQGAPLPIVNSAAAGAAVPEPSTLVLLFGTAMAGLLAYLRKR